MPRAKYSEILKHGTTAEFVAWARNLSNALKSCLTQTADTGQVNWDNVSAIPSVNQTPHYEIYRFDDPAQASVPVFIRVEYGTSILAGRPAIAISAGASTNGAGALGGATYLVRVLSNTGNAADVPVTTYTCYKDGSFTLAWGMNANNVSVPKIVCVLDRTRDGSGIATDEGLITVCAGTTLGNTGVRAFSRRTNTILVSAPTCLMPVDSGASLNSSALGVVNLFNWYCPTPDMQYVTAVFGYKDREIAKLTEIDVAMFGATARHYVTLGTDGFVGSALSPNNVGDAHAILWEV